MVFIIIQCLILSAFYWIFRSCWMNSFQLVAVNKYVFLSAWKLQLVCFLLMHSLAYSGNGASYSWWSFFNVALSNHRIIPLASERSKRNMSPLKLFGFFKRHSEISICEMEVMGRNLRKKKKERGESIWLERVQHYFFLFPYQKEM